MNPPSCTTCNSDDFSSDNWSDADSSKIGVGSNVLNFDSSPDGSNNSSTLDLGSAVSDSEWVMRYEFSPTSKSISNANSHLFVGISSANSSTAALNFLSFL